MTDEEIEEIRERYRELPYTNPSPEDVKELLADVKALLDEVQRLLTDRDELRAEVEQLTRINNQAIERMRIAESHTVAEQERREDAEVAAARLKAALRQILEDPDSRILDSHRDDGWEALK